MSCDEDLGIKLEVDDRLRDIITSGTSEDVIVLLGHDRTGKTLAIKRLLEKLPHSENEGRKYYSLNDPDILTNKPIYEEIRTALIGMPHKKIIIEATPSSISYILNHDFDDFFKYVENKANGKKIPLDKIGQFLGEKASSLSSSDPNKSGTGFENVADFLERDILKKIHELFKGRMVDLRIFDSDKNALLDSFDVEGKRNKTNDHLLLKLASVDGHLMIPCLKEVVENYREADEAIIKSRINREIEAFQGLSVFFGLKLFTKKEATSAIPDFMEISEKMVNFLERNRIIEALPGVLAATIVPVWPLLLGTASIFAFYKEKKEEGFQKFFEAYVLWNELPVDKRVFLCSRLDRKFDQPPHSSYNFLSHFFGKKENVDPRNIKEIYLIFQTYESKLNELTSKHEAFKDEVISSQIEFRSLLSNLKIKLDKLQIEQEKDREEEKEEHKYQMNELVDIKEKINITNTNLTEIKSDLNLYRKVMFAKLKSWIEDTDSCFPSTLTDFTSIKTTQYYNRKHCNLYNLGSLINPPILNTARDELQRDISDTITEMVGDIQKSTILTNDTTNQKNWYKSSTSVPQKDDLNLGNKFIGREWLFAELKSWVKKPDSRMLILDGEMGIGKSAFSAKLADHMNVKVIQYCDRLAHDSYDPRLLIKTLIINIARGELAYCKELDKIPEEPDYTKPSITLLKKFVIEPLDKCQNKLVSKKPWIIVVDGLDEANNSKVYSAEATQSKDISMIDFLIASVKLWPKWFRLIVTTRPDSVILAHFDDPIFTKKSIKTRSVSNQKDVSRYIKTRNKLEGLNISPEFEKRIEDLADGNFHYASTVINCLESKALSLANLGTLPPGLGGLYITIFKNCFPEEKTYVNEVAPLIACLAVTQLPAPKKMLVLASGLNPQIAYQGLRTLSQFLRRDGDKFCFSHQSWNQWLLEEDPMNNPFMVSSEDGYHGLVEACLQELKNEGEEISEYTLSTLPYYLVRLGRTNDLSNILQNPKYIEAICKKDRDEFMAIWSFVEQSTSLRMQTVYTPVFESPSKYDPSVLENVGIMLYDTGYFDSAMTLFKLYESICRGGNFFKGLQKSLYYQGRINEYCDELDVAMTLFKEQESICRENGLMDGLQSSLLGQGHIHYLKGNPDEALKLYDQQELICKEIESYMGLQYNLSGRGIILANHDDLDGAYEIYKKQEEICRKHHFNKELQKCLSNQGFLLAKLGNYEGAMARFYEQEKICRELGYKLELQRCLSLKTYLFDLMGNLNKSIILLKEQIKISRELSNENDESFFLNLLGDLNVRISDNLAAKEAYDTLLSILTSFGDHQGMASCYYSLGDLQLREGNTKEANEAFVEARSLYQKADNKAGEAECNYIIHNLSLLPLEGKDYQMTGIMFEMLDAAATQKFLAEISSYITPVKFVEGKTNVQSADLTFYDKSKLYALSDTTLPTRKPRYVLYKQGDLTLLNWTNEPIYKLNERAPIKLDPNTCADYVRFFFHNVRGQLGRFIIVEKPEDVVWLENATDEEKAEVNQLLKPIVYNGIGNDNLISLTATVVFKNALFKTDIKIAPDNIDILNPETNETEHYSIGQMSITNEELLLENLNVFNDFNLYEQMNINTEGKQNYKLCEKLYDEHSSSPSESNDFPMNDFVVQSLDPTATQKILMDMANKFSSIKFTEGKTIIKYANLPFYEEFKFYMVTDTAQPEANTYYMLYKQGDVVLIDWTNEPIYSVNERAPIKLDSHSCISYIRFFFHYVRGKFGQVVIVEKPEEVVWLNNATDTEKTELVKHLIPITYNGIDHDNFILTATIIFKNALYKTYIKIASSAIDWINPETNKQEHISMGEMRLTDEQLLLEDLHIPIN